MRGTCAMEWVWAVLMPRGRFCTVVRLRSWPWGHDDVFGLPDRDAAALWLDVGDRASSSLTHMRSHFMRYSGSSFLRTAAKSCRRRLDVYFEHQRISMHLRLDWAASTWIFCSCGVALLQSDSLLNFLPRTITILHQKTMHLKKVAFGTFWHAQQPHGEVKGTFQCLNHRRDRHPMFSACWVAIHTPHNCRRLA